MSIKKITVFDIKISYSIFGNGDPILFIHGNSLDKNSMQEVYEPFFMEKNEFQRIYIDLPGMGDSDSSNKINNSDIMLKYLLEFINKLSIGNSLTLFGHSYGGYLSLGIMHKLQNQVIAAYLTCPVIYGENNKRKLEKNRNISEENINDNLKNEFFDDYLKINTRINKKTWQLYNRLIVGGLKKADYEFMDNIQREEQKYYKFSFEDSINILETTLITLLLGRFDTIVGYRDQLNFFECFKNTTISILSDCGHNLFIDNYNFSKSYIDNFIQRVKYL